MHWLNVIRARLRAVFRRDAVIGDIDEEMRLHLDLQTEANIERGMGPAEARREALKLFGNVGRVREAAYEVRGGGMLETLLQDVRYGARVLAKHKGFTLVAVVTLALGIGANTAIFSVVNELLLRPLPFPEADRLVMLWEISHDGQHQNMTSRANFRAWREQNTAFEAMAAFSDQRLNLSGAGDPEEVPVQLATHELFNVLGVRPLLGRSMTEEDTRPGAPDVAVLGYGIWQRRFGGDPSVVGRSITLDGRPSTVVGVLPADFQWHIRKKSGTARPAEIWAPLTMPTEGMATRGRFLSAVGRLKPGVTLAQGEAEMRAIAARLAVDAPQYNEGTSAEVIPLREQFVGEVRPALLVLLGAVGFVLLIACANVANLMLSRVASREKEIAVRTALGARRSRVIRQLLTESLMLALMGSALGLLIAWWGTGALAAISPRELVNLRNVRLDLTVLAWTFGVTLVTGLVFGIAPALEATRLNLNDTLKEGGGKGAGGQGSRSRRLRGSLVVAEVALALMLLASAGLLVKSFVRLQGIDTGFETENVLTTVVSLPEGKYTEGRQMVSFFRQATERIRALPGVREVGMVNYLPLYGGPGTNTVFNVEGRPAPPRAESLDTDVRVIDPGYLGAMGVPLVRGRNFTETEAAEERPVVLVNEAMARKHFPGEDPIGRRVIVEMFEEPTPTEIVGVVGDVRYDSLVDEAEPTVYFSHPVLTYPFMTLVVRTTGEPTAMAAAVRREVQAVDPDQSVADVRTMSQVMSETTGRARFQTLLLALFAGLATLLAAVGIFGVMNYSVQVRTHEIGLRMALGAQPGRVLMLILRQGLVLTLAGVCLGLVGALALTRVMSGLLFGVEATDPLTFAVIVVLLTAVSLLACYIPARRATRIDPMVALRYE